MSFCRILLKPLKKNEALQVTALKVYITLLAIKILILNYPFLAKNLLQ